MGKARKLRQKRGWAYAVSIGILRPLLMLLTKRRWLDPEKLPPEGGCVLVANHISHLDPITFAHFAFDNGRLPRFLAKQEVFKVPVVGTIVRSAQQIPVYRMSTDASRAFSAAVEAVGRGECVVVYPEGTITRDPDMWPMVGKTGAARIALSSGAPVVPVAQWGPNHILAPYTKRFHIFPRKTITMKVGDPVALDDLRSRTPSPEVLNEATARIMDALTVLLEDIRSDTAPPVRFDLRACGVKETGNPHPRVTKKKGSR